MIGGRGGGGTRCGFGRSRSLASTERVDMPSQLAGFVRRVLAGDAQPRGGPAGLQRFGLVGLTVRAT